MSSLSKILIPFIFLFLFYTNLIANDLWVRVSNPVSTPLFNCTFPDSMNGWAAGDFGVIIHTSNGGNSFEIQNSTVNFYINDIFFINKRLGWAVSNEFLLNGSTILRTTNGGQNWSAENFPDSTKFFRTVYFLDSLTGFLGGFQGIIYKTTDAGNSWFQTVNESSEFSEYPVKKFNFISQNIGFACGGQIDIAGVVWKTTNGGLLWKAQGLSPEPFYGMYAKDSENVIAAGGDFEYGVQISTTSNAGSNWVYESLQLFGQAESIDFRTENEAWMPLGFAESWAVSYNGGTNWTTIPTKDSSIIYSVTFIDSTHGWAVGFDGAILKYNPAKVSIDEINDNANPENFSLSQNYPNPFNPNTIINYKFTLPTGGLGQVSLKVYDVLGNTVAVLINEKQTPGNYRVEFTGNNLPSGIYYYELRVVDDAKILFSETKKMVMVK